MSFYTSDFQEIQIDFKGNIIQDDDFIRAKNIIYRESNEDLVAVYNPKSRNFDKELSNIKQLGKVKFQQNKISILKEIQNSITLNSSLHNITLLDYKKLKF